jgi:DNA modification methylase
MTAQLLVRRDDVSVFHATHQELLAILPHRDDGTKVDMLFADCPYSDKTHKGHDAGTVSANNAGAYAARVTSRGQDKDRRYATRKAERGEDHRRRLAYPPWTKADVDAFMDAWAPVVRGWIVSQTDDVLFPFWREAAARHGRLTFQDVPAIISGMTCRMTGDGPSSWAIHQMVCRPRSREFATWGTLPGGYYGPAEEPTVVGGKPMWLCERMIEHYSRPHDLICDPTCGGGTALEAALRTGRRAVGGDQMLAHAELSAARVSRPVQRPLFAAGGAE